MNHPFRVWRPHRYQSDSGLVPVDQWAPAFDAAQAPDAPSLVVNMDDIGRPYTLETCRIECATRNDAQLKRARASVEELQKELDLRTKHLAEAERAMRFAVTGQPTS